MGEIMHPIPFGNLINWAQKELKERGSIFGVSSDKFYKANTQISWFGENLGTVIGPAAGPHSQLSQNIVAAYLTGSRFIELKTVQQMDGEALRACISRPCINAQDEGYNCEWSTELTVEEAFDEYVKAFIMLQVLQLEQGFSHKRDFIFNMSVGYDLEGIKSPKIDGFIEGLKDASNTDIWKNSIGWLHENIETFTHLKKADIDALSPNVCSSITLSTLHGCPPQEIENIALYLMEEKGLTTFVKCNPTLLGYETARELLDSMGYAYLDFDDHHFKADLQFADAVPMLQRLQAKAKEMGLGFGVKITNTFPVKQNRGELPAEEMYMSGRALLPLSLKVAEKISDAFGGTLPISYSGGADAENIERLFATGIYPITLATTILKPGGYERFSQMAKLLEGEMAAVKENIDTKKVSVLLDEIGKAPNYQKSARVYASRKTDKNLELFDCFSAPCVQGGCPIEQQAPAYMGLVGMGAYEKAMEVIAIDNPAPAITSVICPHPCQSKCVRMDYESPLEIRSVKHFVVTNAMDKMLENISAKPLQSDKKVAVIGAGPAGIATAYYLRRNGVDVTVLEKRDKPFGMVEYLIPKFRIGDEMLFRDYQLAVKTGVKFTFGTDPNVSIEDLQKSYDFVVLATGAWGQVKPTLQAGAERVLDSLAVLEDAKKHGGKTTLLGEKVAIIGGGDVAMDVARVAKKNPATKVASIVYRRTKEFLPAQMEEIQGAFADGVNILELLNPTHFDGKTLVCEKMQLGAYDQSGRRGVVTTGESVKLDFDSVIFATGATVETEMFTKQGFETDSRSFLLKNETLETSKPGVYVAGDLKAGPATIVEAMQDGKIIACDILEKLGLNHDFVRIIAPKTPADFYPRKGVHFLEKPKTQEETLRCLGCSYLCEICNDVCPNRANIYVEVSKEVFGVEHQILHIDGMCNECGNCETFCPKQGAPYLDKLTLFWSKEGFEESKNIGFLPLGGNTYLVRKEDGEVVTYKQGGDGVSLQLQEMIKTVPEWVKLETGE